MGQFVRSVLGFDSYSRETLFRVLRNQRRRYALHYLKQREGVVTVGDLAEQIAAWETETPILDVDSDDRRRVYISLLQSHLPTLDAAGIVQFDEERSEVQLTESAKNIDIYVELVPDTDIQWPTYYLALTVFSGLFLVIAASRVFPLDQFSMGAWVGFVVCLFGLSATIHHVYQRQTRLGVVGDPPE